MTLLCHRARAGRGFGRLALTALAAVVSAPWIFSYGGSGDTRLPTAGEVKKQQQQYHAERDALVTSGALPRFLPSLLDLADAAAKRGNAAAKEGRLLQAWEAYRQARWQLPYQGPDFPDHVAKVFGNLRLRHGDEILAIAFSPDGSRLATAGRDRAVIIWDLANGHEVVAYRGHERYVRTLAFSPDGKWIVSAGGDSDIHLWDPQTGKEVRTLKGTGNYTTALVVSPDGKYVFAAGDDKTLRIYDAASGEIKRTLGEFEKAGSWRSLAFNPDGTRFVAGADNGQVRLWRYPEIVTLDAPEYWTQQDAEGSCNFLTFAPDSKQLVRGGQDSVKVYKVPQPGAAKTVQAPRLIWRPPLDPKSKERSHHFTCAAFSKDGKTLFTGCTDGAIRLFDMATGNTVGSFTGHHGEITGLALNAQGTQLASASTDYTIRLWNFDIVVRGLDFSGHTGPIWAADFSPDGQRLVSCGADRTLRLWDTATAAFLRNFGDRSAGLTTTHFAPDGKSILSGGGNGVLRIHDVESGKLLQTFQGHTSTVTSAAFNQGGSKVVSGSMDKTVIVWSTATGKALATIPTGSLVMAVAFTPDGKQVVAGSADRRVRFFHAATGKPGPEWLAHGAAVAGLSFDARGEFLATCGFDGLVKIWSAAVPGKLVETLAGHVGPVSAVAFRADGKYLVSAGSDRVVKLWKNDKGRFRLAQVFRGHRDWVTTLAFGNSGYQVLSASADGTIKIWEIASRELPLTSEHTGAVQCLAVSPDGKVLASGGTDKTIKLWDPKTGGVTLTIRGHDQKVVALAFSPDGKTLVSSGGDRNIRRWNVATGQELAPLANQQNLTGFINPVPQLALAPDGKRLIAWIPFDERGTRVSTLDAATGAECAQINDRGKNIQAVAWTGDLKRVALGASDGIVRIYSIRQDKADDKPADFQVFKDVAVTSLAFVGDGAFLAVGGDDGEVFLVESTTGLPRKKLAAHAQRVYGLASSPDGKRLASVGLDNTVKLWDVATGNALRQWTMPDVVRKNGGFVSQLAFTPDGRFLMTANANTTLFMLELP